MLQRNTKINPETHMETQNNHDITLTLKTAWHCHKTERRPMD
jgi:hypothetical protein